VLPCAASFFIEFPTLGEAKLVAIFLDKVREASRAALIVPTSIRLENLLVRDIRLDSILGLDRIQLLITEVVETA